MKTISFIIFMALTSMIFGQTADTPIATYEYQIVTSIESIIPSGLGRSRLIAETGERDYKDFTSERTEEDGGRNKSKRSDIRVKDFEETKMLNFFNIGGIRFENIASNDAIVASKINDLSANGWELAFVTSGVESNGGVDDGEGIFITRYIFKRLRQ
ncbi:MAG: hypothetical protein R3E32_16050 [Chitinophagales bacterium]